MLGENTPKKHLSTFQNLMSGCADSFLSQTNKNQSFDHLHILNNQAIGSLEAGMNIEEVDEVSDDQIDQFQGQRKAAPEARVVFNAADGTLKVNPSKFEHFNFLKTLTEGTNEEKSESSAIECSRNQVMMLKHIETGTQNSKACSNRNSN